MTAHDRDQAVLDAALLPAPLVERIVAGYRELAAENYRLGLHDEALYCQARADALSWGGSITMGMVTP